LTEDFDVTLQIHRNKLGKVQFIPNAIAYTQDPRTIRDYIKQITRWNRGIMQGMIKHRVGLRPHRVDAYLSYQVFQNFFFFINYFILLPLLAANRDVQAVLATTFMYDVLITFGIVFAVALKARRIDIISAYPHIYLLRWVSLGVFLKAFAEVVILRKFLNNSSANGTWSTGARRYVSNIDLVTTR
jgi:cellulose synthase/poly-beta-1,6-N-acetylglucosamine synthase-like glycosyltransferase